MYIFIDGDKDNGDSASSSSSALAEPACTQLLNHRHYHHITKDEDSSGQVSLLMTCKVSGLKLLFLGNHWENTTYAINI